MQIWQLDRDWYRTVHVDWHRDWLDLPMIGITSTGLGWVQLLVLLALALFAPGARSYAVLLLWSGSLCGLLRLGVMRAADRQRPSNYEFARPLEDIFGNTSFPSGHTACSFAIAVMLVILVRRSEWEWVGWLAVLWAFAVGFSRVYLGVHYPMDVLGGALFGMLSAGAAYVLADRFKWLTRLGLDQESRDVATPNLPS